MATWLGNFVSIVGGSGARMRIETQLAGQNIAGNYSTINYQTYIDFNSSDAQLDGGWVQSSAGVHYNNGGRVYNYAGNFSNHSVNMNNGSFNIGHAANGTGSYGMNAHVTVYQKGTTTASGSEGLPTIPRAATLSALSMDGGGIPATDEGPMWVEFANPAGSAVQVFIDSLDGAGRIYTSGYVGSRHNVDFSGGTLTAALQNARPNSNTGTIRIGIYDASFGQYDYRDRTYTIKNDAGQANPTFSTIAYHDSNSTTSTITGNDQYIIQDQSVINADIASGNKAVAVKGASMVSYTASINAIATNFAYSGSTINQALNTGSAGASTDQTLSITATDSRGNTTTANKTVTMVPYVAPTLDILPTREDGFGADTTLDLTGHISTITVASVDKNSVNTTTGIGYKVWKVVGGSEPGSYTNVPNTTTTGTVNPTSDPIETLSQNDEWYLKVKITDALQTVTVTTVIGVGKAALRIGTDGYIYNENKRIFALLDMYPVGTVVIRNVNTNPQTLYGGTWTATSTASASLFGETLYAFKRTV